METPKAKDFKLIGLRPRKSRGGYPEKIKLVVQRFLAHNIDGEKLQVIYDNLSIKERISLLLMLMPYGIAKQSEQMDLNKLSGSQIDDLYERILNSTKQAK